MGEKTLEKQIVALDTETTNKNPHKAKLLGISLHRNGVSEYCIDGEHAAVVYKDDLLVLHNGKYDAIILKNNKNIDIRVGWDTIIAYYLLHIDKPRKLETIVKEVFDVKKKDLLDIYNECSGKERKTLPDKWWEEVPEEALAVYAQEDVKWTYKLYEVLSKELDANPILKDWFEKIEMPLCNILVKSELNGVLIDVKHLEGLKVEWGLRRDSLLNSLRVMADNEELNLNSPKQLQEVLYKKLKLQKLVKTKTGWSTKGAVLERLKNDSGFVRKLLQYREIEKLLNSFVDKLINEADGEGRIHPTFNQCLTKTRRFSCQDPNLQQIPSKSVRGKEIRNCFIPRPGYKFLVADYSQIELRLLAHFSGDEKLVTWFNNDEDIHTHTANLIANELGREFTRDKGKLLNFSIIYGKSAYGFAQDWNCTEEEAQRILDIYFKQFPRVKNYIENCKLVGRNNQGWIKSLAGLPLYISNINSNNRWEWEEAGRQVVNYRIQASSQDIIKTAIVNIYKYNSLVPCLMVHDELVYEIPNKKIWLEHGVQETVKLMESAWKLNVPLKADFKIVERWEK